MILEYEVALWVQIAPMSTDGSLPSPPPDSNHQSVKYCDLFPLRFYPIVEGEEEEGIHFAHDDHFSNLTYTLNGYSRRLLNGTIETIFDPPTQETETEVCQDSTVTTATWVQRSQSVEHLWFHQWDDFSIPERQYDEVIDRITTRAAEYLSQNKTVVISCFSGRGRYAHALRLTLSSSRSGTLAAIVGAKVYKLKTISEVVDLIVRMRRSRDGLVETPQQLNYLLTLLNRYADLSLEDGDGGGGQRQHPHLQALGSRLEMSSFSLDAIVIALISLALLFGVFFL
jgi:protein-tyrosine phosphatase